VVYEKIEAASLSKVHWHLVVENNTLIRMYCDGA